MIVEWEDLNNKPYLMQVLGSGILSDMVLEVAVEGVSIDDATTRAQKRAEELIERAK